MEILKESNDYRRELRSFGSAQEKDVRVEKLANGSYKVTAGSGFDGSQLIEFGAGEKEAMRRFMRFVNQDRAITVSTHP